MADDRQTPTMIHVCVTCRVEGEAAAEPQARAGRRLFDALAAELRSAVELSAAADHEPCPRLSLLPVECLSVCKRPCTVSFSAPGKWTYVYGDLPAETAAPTILAAARLYAAAPEGLIPWKARPAAIKTGVIARVPPLPTRPECRDDTLQQGDQAA